MDLISNNGNFTDNGRNSYTFQPDANFNGVVTLSYGVSDGQAVTTTSTTFTLDAVNDAPIVLTFLDNQTTEENQAFSYQLPTDALITVLNTLNNAMT